MGNFKACMKLKEIVGQPLPAVR